jgi:hypothetical protein
MKNHRMGVSFLKKVKWSLIGQGTLDERLVSNEGKKAIWTCEPYEHVRQTLLTKHLLRLGFEEACLRMPKAAGDPVHNDLGSNRAMDNKGKVNRQKSYIDTFL